MMSSSSSPVSFELELCMSDSEDEPFVVLSLEELAPKLTWKLGNSPQDVQFILEDDELDSCKQGLQWHSNYSSEFMKSVLLEELGITSDDKHETVFKESKAELDNKEETVEKSERQGSMAKDKTTEKNEENRDKEVNDQDEQREIKNDVGKHETVLKESKAELDNKEETVEKSERQGSMAKDKTTEKDEENRDKEVNDPREIKNDVGKQQRQVLEEEEKVERTGKQEMVANNKNVTDDEVNYHDKQYERQIDVIYLKKEKLEKEGNVKQMEKRDIEVDKKSVENNEKNPNKVNATDEKLDIKNDIVNYWVRSDDEIKRLRKKFNSLSTYNEKLKICHELSNIHMYVNDVN